MENGEWGMGSRERGTWSGSAQVLLLAAAGCCDDEGPHRDAPKITKTAAANQVPRFDTGVQPNAPTWLSVHLVHLTGR